jgi:hypothetical protein
MLKTSAVTVPSNAISVTIAKANVSRTPRGIEAFAVFVHPRDPNLVFVGTVDGVCRSTDRGQNFRRADFPDRDVQVWSFLYDDADPKRIMARGSPVSIYRSEDSGASWKRAPDPQYSP